MILNLKKSHVMLKANVSIIFCKLACLFALLSSTVFGTVSVRVFSYDEGLSETNVSKPRIYIENTGTESINGLSYFYYFETEDDKVPVWEDHYSPDEDIVLEQYSGNVYRMKYTVSRTINPGEHVPDNAGNSISLHYNDWSVWDKNNDYSNNGSCAFAENQNIAVYVNGAIVYGSEPVASGNPIDPSEGNYNLQSFALYSTEQSVVKDNSIFSGGGAIGSNTYVEIGAGANITGNIVSGESALIRSDAVIQGDIIVADSATMQAGLQVTGTVQENVQVGTISIPARSVTTGHNDIVVASGTSLNLNPGLYSNLTVEPNATVELSTGNYTFNSFILQTDASTVFNTAADQKIEIDVQGDFQISDRASMQFSGFPYAPAVQIYTNDANSIQIGCDSRVAGIITAPHATVTMFSRAQCDGAIYAKEILIEADAVIISNMVDPEGDADGDGLSNYTEVFLTKTDPSDSTSYKEIAIPVPSKIDNTSDVRVVYEAGRFFHDYSHDSIIVNFKQNSLFNTDLAPELKISNVPVDLQTSDTLDLPVLTGYETVGRYLLMDESAMTPSGRAQISFPLPKDEIPSPEMYSIALYKKSTGWTISSTDYYAPIYTLSTSLSVDVEIPSATAMIIVKKRVKVTAYLDNGMVFSNEEDNAAVQGDILIKDCTIESGTFTIHYKDYSDPNNPVQTQQEFSLYRRIIPGSIGHHLGSKRIQIVSNGRIEVTRTVLQVGTDIIEQDMNYIVDKGDRLKLSAAKTLNQFRTSGELTASKSFSLNFESADMNGEGRIIPVPPSVSPEKFRYECYLKDHLGSTRMVMNEDGEIVEVMAYQPYGEMVQLRDIAVTPELPAREKFTGKELDEEGPEEKATISIFVSFDDPGMDWGDAQLYLILTNGMSFPSELQDGRSVVTGMIKSFEYDVVIDQLIIRKSGFEYIVDDINCLVAKGKRQDISLQNVTGDDIRSAAEEGRNLFTFEAQVDGAPLAYMGLYYFGARFYDADVGIWVSTDPLEEFYNSYSYVGGNPVNLIDEYGLNSRGPSGGGSNGGGFAPAGSNYGGGAYTGSGIGGGYRATKSYTMAALNITGFAPSQDAYGAPESAYRSGYGPFYSPRSLNNHIYTITSSGDLVPANTYIFPKMSGNNEENYIIFDDEEGTGGENVVATNSVDFPFDLSRNTGDYNGPMLYNKEFISIARGMEMDKVAKGFRNVIIGEFVVIGGAAGAYYLGPAIATGAQAAWPHVVAGGTAAYKFGESSAYKALDFYNRFSRQVNFGYDYVSGLLTPPYSGPPTTTGGQAAAVTGVVVDQVKKRR